MYQHVEGIFKKNIKELYNDFNCTNHEQKKSSAVLTRTSQTQFRGLRIQGCLALTALDTKFVKTSVPNSIVVDI